MVRNEVLSAKKIPDPFEFPKEDTKNNWKPADQWLALNTWIDFSDFLMYKPKGGDGEWVPLRLGNWSVILRWLADGSIVNYDFRVKGPGIFPDGKPISGIGTAIWARIPPIPQSACFPAWNFVMTNPSALVPLL
jgi:hypothetical protein